MFLAAQNLLPSLLLKGSESTKAFVAQCSAKGIQIAAEPTEDKIALHVSCPVGQEAELIPVVMQLLTRPVVDAPTFQNVKEDLIKTLRNVQSNPDVRLGEAVLKNLYGPQHPYSLTCQETIQALSQATPEAVMGLYQQVLNAPERAFILMVSPQPLDVQQHLLNQGIHQFTWFANPYGRTIIPDTPPVPSTRGRAGPVLVANEGIPRAHIIQAWRVPTVSDPDYPAFLLIQQIYSGMSSGFFEVLRTRNGLVYSTQQQMNQQKQAGAYTVKAEVNFDRIDKGLKGIEDVVQSLVRNPVSPQELASAKEKVNFQLNHAMQTTAGIAGISNAWLQSDLPAQHPNALKVAVARVTPEDIQRVANRVFNPAYGAHVIGISAPHAVLKQWVASHKTP